MDSREIAAILTRALGRAAEPPSFLPLLDGIRESLQHCGIEADRIQVPMSRGEGFRHPTLGLVLLTWTHDRAYADTEVMGHDQLDALTRPGVQGTPYENILLHGADHLRLRLEADDGGYAVLRRLREEGYRDYCAVGLRMPTGGRQPMSVASLRPMPDDLPERLSAIEPLLAMAVYGVYRTSQAVRLAQAYIGLESGPRVLAGDIVRGSTRRIEAGIMFCDIRGFTAMSEALGAEAVVAVVNRVFDAVESEAGPRGGEILKFIGDAMLIVFPVAGPEDRPRVAQAMVDAAQAALPLVQALARELDLPLGVGFGGHLGEVVQGNVGTRQRLDFTVMGPAVNLASRLESLCKPLQARGAWSEAVARHVPELVPAGVHAVKGIAEPVAVWTLPEVAEQR